MKRTASGKNGVVSSAHPLATRAGLGILKRGGNAVDAAIAVGLALGVVAPAWSGMGGGGFALIHLATSGETVAVDYREVAPKKAHANMFELDEAGHVKNDSNAIGTLAIAVPGAASGIAVVQKRWGTMKLTDICRFARDQAATGTRIGPALGLVLVPHSEPGIYPRCDCSERRAKLLRWKHWGTGSNVPREERRHTDTRGFHRILDNNTKTGHVNIQRL